MSAASQIIEGFLSPLLERLRQKAANPRSWGIILIVIILIVGGHFLASQSRQVVKGAIELGSLLKFTGRPEATDDGTFVSFLRGTEMGGGLFAYNLKSGQQRLLYEDSGNHKQAQQGWSPDGKLLAFSGWVNGKNMLMIYNNELGQIELQLNLSSAVSEFEWLSPSSFVFLKDGTTHLASRKQNDGLMRADKQPNGGWIPPYYFAKEETKTNKIEKSTVKYMPIKGLMATSSDSVAWIASNAIWQLKCHDSEPVILWKGSATNRIVTCSYSSESGAFLLNLQNADQRFLASYSPFSRQFFNLGEISTNAVNVCWINHGKGFAYLLNEEGSHAIFSKTDCNNKLPIQSYQQEGIREFVNMGNTTVEA